MTGLPLRPFYFLRHGQTDWNLEHRAMGSQDIPLNDRGISQGLNAAELLKNEPIATIVSSPLRRARKTADIIAQHIKAPVIEITELQEVCWGEKEGMLKGKGYGAKTLSEFLDFFRREFDGSADTFIIDPASNNPRAKHVYMKAGFEHIADFVMGGDCSGAGKSHHLLIRRFVPNVRLSPATISDYPTIQNMARFYVYDRTAYMGWECPESGLFKTEDELRNTENPDPYAMNVFTFDINHRVNNAKDDISVRLSQAGDIQSIVEMSYQKRLSYEKAQPKFWKYAGDIAELSQAKWFKELLGSNDHIMLTATCHQKIVGFIIGKLMPAPEVYNPGRLTLMIDDFCVTDESEWHSIGSKLVQKIKAIAKLRGAAQVLIVCGAHDGPKCHFLKKIGLTVASEWYVGVII